MDAPEIKISVRFGEFVPEWQIAQVATLITDEPWNYLQGKPANPLVWRMRLQPGGHVPEPEVRRRVADYMAQAEIQPRFFDVTIGSMAESVFEKINRLRRDYYKKYEANPTTIHFSKHDESELGALSPREVRNKDDYQTLLVGGPRALFTRYQDLAVTWDAEETTVT